MTLVIHTAQLARCKLVKHTAHLAMCAQQLHQVI